MRFFPGQLDTAHFIAWKAAIPKTKDAAPAAATATPNQPRTRSDGPVVTNSTMSRRNTVKRLLVLAGAREIYPNITAVRFLLYLRQIYPNPTTALSYIGTTAFLFPRAKLDPE